MKTEELFLTVEQARHLQELGLDMSDAAFIYVHVGRNKWEVFPKWMLNEDNHDQERVYTYTLQEVLGKLPYGFDYFNLSYKNNHIGYYDDSCKICMEEFYFINEPLKAAYSILCWVLEKGYLKGGKQ